MKITIKGNPKEIAALVLAVQEQQKNTNEEAEEITKKLMERAEFRKHLKTGKEK